MNIVIVGTSGTGKTTLGKQLAAALGLKQVSLDTLYWQPGWQRPDKEEFLSRVADVVSENGWVIDGNYGTARDVVWPKADVAIWLDFSLWSALRGAFTRVLSKQPQAEGCVDSLWKVFFSKDSIFLWIFKSHFRNRRVYGDFLKNNTYPNVRIVRLTRRISVERILDLIS